MTTTWSPPRTSNPFWVDDQGRWVDAEDLQSGDLLLLADGSTVKVDQVSERSAVQSVHNLTVDGIHTYFVVAGDNEVLVHNCGSGARYTRGSAQKSFSHGHAANSPRIAGKSRFRVSEGGQKFTNEVKTHPNVEVSGGGGMRTRYDVDDLGRGPVGWDRHGNPAFGGRVVVEGTNPHPMSKFMPGEVVTQFPS